MDNVLVAYLCGGIIVGSLVYVFVKAVQQKRVRYMLKVTVNSYRFPVSLLWVAYFMIVAANFMVNIRTMTDAMAAIQMDELNRFFILRIPLAYLLTVVGIDIKVIMDSMKPLIKYNEQEREWVKESNTRFQARMDKIMFWKKVKAE